MSLLTQIAQRLKPSSSSLGLEITDSSIKIAELSSNKSKTIQLRKFAFEILPELIIEDGRIKQPLRFMQTLQEMVYRNELMKKSVHVVIPSQGVMVRFLKLPDVPEAELRKIVDFEVKHNLRLPFDEPYYDFIKLNGSNAVKIKKKPKPKKGETTQEAKNNSWLEAAASKEDGIQGGTKSLFEEFENDANESLPNQPQQCDIMLVAAPLEMINEYIELIAAAGLKPISMEFKALSLFRLMQKTQMTQTEGTFLMVDINGTSSDLSIFNASQLKITRNVPLIFTDKKEQKEPYTEEEQIFAQFTQSENDSEFQNVCNDLAHELERLMNFYRYTLNNRNQEFDVVMLSGDISRLSEVAELLQIRLTQQKVKLVFSNAIESALPNMSEILPILAVPIGAALREE